MKKAVYSLLALAFMGCSTSIPTPNEQQGPNIRIVVGEGNEFEPGAPIMLINKNGDTIAPMGKYEYIGELPENSDLVMVFSPQDKDAHFALVDEKGNELDYRVFPFDNGPDEVSEGMMRIVDKDGKMGYADSLGHLVIAPRFFFVKPWEDGHGTVAIEGTTEPSGEHKKLNVKEWQQIDKDGYLSPCEE